MERAVIFGPGDELVGVFSDPPDRRADAPVVLLSNAGVLPRQGPHRLNVRIARMLAQEAVASFRFDLSGHGDSLPIRSVEGVRAQAVRDFISAMDRVQQETGISRFYIVGICSGAVNAYDVALADERVAGVLMYDGFWFRSRWTRPVHTAKRVMNADWPKRLSAVRRRLLLLRSPAAPSRPAAADAVALGNSDFGNPPLPQFVDAMQRLVDRGTSVMFVYGGSVMDYYSYARQFRDVFGRYPFCDVVRCEFHPELDHTFITRHAQTAMTDLIRSWVIGAPSPVD